MCVWRGGVKKHVSPIRKNVILPCCINNNMKKLLDISIKSG